ncbi:MAG: terpene cyclase/mutase family protein [Planctomycetes bacterium]|nr:terpene cyclase/mutase family protein [Planctomycetota bacterium]
MTRTLAAPVFVAAAFGLLAPALPAQVSPELAHQINLAVDKGAKWLKERQLKKDPDKGSWGTGDNPLYPGQGGAAHKDEIGITALALLALLKCDVDPEDPVIVDGFAYIDKNMDKSWKTTNVNLDTGKKQVSTYETGVLLMAIEALYDGRMDKAIRAAKKDPKKVQHPPIQLAKDHLTLVKGAVKWLKDMQSPKGGWRYGEPLFPSPGGMAQDVSATQVVLLGLTSALRMGVEVDPQIFVKAGNWNLEAQEKDGPGAKPGAAPAAPGAGAAVSSGGGGSGKTVAVRDGDKVRGWAYAKGSTDENEGKASGSMTACGVCSLILVKASLRKSPLLTKDLLSKLDRGIYDGVAWLDANWTVETNPGGHRSHYYYLYGLERVGMLGSIDFIGAHPWYAEGAAVLVKAQQPDGKWYTKTEVEPGDVIDTCLALLFLKKATMPVGAVLSR